jgi:hypothetical protein
MEPYEIVSGPLTLWLAPVGTAFPAIDEAPAVAWKMIGQSGTKNYSEDGVSVSHAQSINKARGAGSVGGRKAFRTEEDMGITVTLWDNTLEMYALALHGDAPVATAAGAGSAGFKTIGLSRGAEVKQYALLARGMSAYDEVMAAQYEVPRCYQAASPTVLYNKGVPAGIELNWDALEDLEAANDHELFGRLVMQHQAPLP